MRSLTLATLALAACAPKPIISTPPAACAKLVPNAWRNGVPGAKLPASPVRDGDPLKDVNLLEAALNDWMKFGVSQSTNLSTANGRTKAVISIVTDCETRVNASRP